jgi:uncharacterized peroxidase-related enzyme
MPRVPTIPPELAPPESRAVYEEFYVRMSFPSAPNFIMTQGHAPSVARGTWELVRNVLVDGRIARWIKEMMFVAISHDRQCHYCEAAHIACCRMLGVNAQHLKSLVRDIRSIGDPKLRDMIMFAVKCAREPQKLNDEDFQSLRRHGLLDSEVLEIIAMAGVAVYANIMADATGMEPDPMFVSIGAR